MVIKKKKKKKEIEERTEIGESNGDRLRPGNKELVEGRDTAE